MSHLLGFIRWLTPRFVTEDWACELYWDDELDCEAADPWKAMGHVQPGEVFDGIITLRHFCWLGMVFGADQPGAQMRPWVNPHDGVAS